MAKLKTTMQNLQATPTRLSPRPNIHISDTLLSASHVFVRRDAVRTPLHQPYDGPYRIITRFHKYFTLQIKGRQDTVSIDRLKRAHLERDLITTPPPTTLTSTSILSATECHKRILNGCGQFLVGAACPGILARKVGLAPCRSISQSKVRTKY